MTRLSASEIRQAERLAAETSRQLAEDKTATESRRQAAIRYARWKSRQPR